MPITEDIKITAPERAEYVPLPADVYQVQISDLEVRTGKKYMSEEEQQQILFKMLVVDKSDNRGHGIGAFSTTRWFNGGKNMSPSKLFQIFTAVYAYYHKDIDLNEWYPEMVNMQAINDLIGKQLRITVNLTQDKKNKITSFMPIREELEPIKDEEVKAVKPEPEKSKKKKEAEPLDENDFTA